MITCRQAEQLFDCYLDDALSSSIQAEFHAHVLQCSECQNELAIREACGDVIRLDRCEPVLSASFTDRVMAGRRERQTTKPRPWRRIAIFVGSPMAAAASIVLAFLWMGPAAIDTKPVPGGNTVVAVRAVAAPKSVQKKLTELTDKKLSPEAKKELASTPEMPALPFLDALLAPVMEGTRNAVEGTRRTAADLELLIRYSLAGMNDQLVAEYRAKYPDESHGRPMAQRVASDLDPLDPAFLEPEFPAPESPNPASTGESHTGSEVPEAI